MTHNPDQTDPFDRVDPQLAEIRSDPRIDQAKLNRGMEQAQQLLYHLDPTDDHAGNGDGLPWCSGTGTCNIPADPDDAPVVRIALWVTHDDRFERVPLAGGYAYTSVPKTTPVQFAEVMPITDGLPDRVTYTAHEKTVIDAIATHIFGDPDADTCGAIQHFATQLECDDVRVHFFLFDKTARDALLEATARHLDETGPAVRSLYSLLSLRAGITHGDIDEPMVSLLQNDIGDRLVLPVSTGLLGTYAQLVNWCRDQFTVDGDGSPHLLAPPTMAGDDDIATGYDDWEYHADGHRVSLYQTFKHQFFDRFPDTLVPTDGGLVPECSAHANPEPPHTTDLPTRLDPGSQLPLGHVWGPFGELQPGSDREQKLVDEFGQVQDVSKHVYREPPASPRRPADYPRNRRTPLDLTQLAEHIAHIVATIERLLAENASGELTAEKHRRPPMEWRHLELGGATLTRGAREMVEKEHYTQREERKQITANPVPDRIADGEAIAVEITNIHTDSEDAIDNDLPAIRASGRLRVNAGTEASLDSADETHEWITDPATIRRHLEFEEGDYVVAQHMREGRPVFDHGKHPEGVFEGVHAVINWISDDTNGITLNFFRGTKQRKWSSYFRERHMDAVLPEELDALTPEEADLWPNKVVPIVEGWTYVIDKPVDSLPEGRTHSMLNLDQPPAFLQLLERVVQTDSVPTGTCFDRSNVDTILTQLVATANDDDGADDDDADDDDSPELDVDVSPISEQQRRVGELTDPRLFAVQGPFGTGKSSGALSMAITAKSLDLTQRGEPSVLCVSTSANKSCDEIAVDSGKRVEQAREIGLEGADETLVARIASGDPELDASEFEEVAYVGETDQDRDEYFGDQFTFDDRSPTEVVKQRLRARGLASGGELSPSKDEPVEDAPLILVATPTKLWSFLSDLWGEYSAPDLARADVRFFDGYAIDEGSQYTLGKTAIPGSFITSDSQVIVGGDHRQLEAVTKYDWEDATRTTINGVAAHLSVMSYLRLANGKEVPGVDREDLEYAFDSSIPYIRLRTTFRCCRTITQFCAKVYEDDGDDGLDLETHESNRYQRITPPDPHTDALQSIVDHKIPLVTVTHDDRRGGDQSETEAAIIIESITAMPTADTSEDADDIEYEESIGVVCAHSDQADLIRGKLEAHPDINDTAIKVDTADGFQGSEEDVILVSLSASDPDYISSEDEFILSDNRTLVSLSRARKKVILAASRELLATVPDDPTVFQETRLLQHIDTATRAADRLADQPDATRPDAVRVDGYDDVSVFPSQSLNLDDIVSTDTRTCFTDATGTTTLTSESLKVYQFLARAHEEDR